MRLYSVTQEKMIRSKSFDGKRLDINTISFSYESHIYINGYINKQNFREMELSKTGRGVWEAFVVSKGDSLVRLKFQ